MLQPAACPCSTAFRFCFLREIRLRRMNGRVSRGGVRQRILAFRWVRPSRGPGDRCHSGCTGWPSHRRCRPPTGRPSVSIRARRRNSRPLPSRSDSKRSMIWPAGCGAGGGFQFLGQGQGPLEDQALQRGDGGEGGGVSGWRSGRSCGWSVTSTPPGSVGTRRRRESCEGRSGRTSLNHCTDFHDRVTPITFEKLRLFPLDLIRVIG